MTPTERRISGPSPRRDWENVVWLELSALLDSSLQHTQHFDRLSENHHWLQGWLWRRLGCHANAEDLTQDTFLSPLKSIQLASIEEPGRFCA
ncbi:sigma factor [Pseudomonas piscis]|uniref:sigma factor n=1 Tax=Pseudomonas piscis TaxID=2614538 RepID=UPI000FFCAB99|nr:sigma factor [Pseudomonas piscis]